MTLTERIRAIGFDIIIEEVCGDDGGVNGGKMSNDELAGFVKGVCKFEERLYGYAACMDENK